MPTGVKHESHHLFHYRLRRPLHLEGLWYVSLVWIIFGLPCLHALDLDIYVPVYMVNIRIQFLIPASYLRRRL